MKKTNLIPRLRSGLTLSKVEELKSALAFFSVIFVIGFAFISLAAAEELTQQAKITPPAQESKDSTSPVRNTETEGLNKISNGTRIIVTTSGPAKFSSHWLDNPPRLVVEFQTENVVSKIGGELLVNEGVIKKITSEYYSGIQKTLKSLTFELLEKAPYKIWQEENNIILDIQASLGQPLLSNEGKEVFAKDESREQIVKRLAAMDATLKQTQESQPSAMVLGDIQETNRTVKHVASTKADQSKVVLAEPIKVRKKWLGIILWFAGLVSISGLGFKLWRKYVVGRTKNLTERIRELKLQLEKKDALLEQVEIIRKTIEKTAIEKEKEQEQLKLELQEKSRLFEQEAAIRSEKEKALSEKEKEYEHLKGTSESLKDVLIKRGIARQLTLPESKGELWILGKSPERRNLPRLALTKDFHNTVILKIELPNTLKQIKSFAENISSDGLCFKTKGELDEKNPLNLRLFFYGGKVPNFRTQGWIVWKRTCDSKNYYGITFEGLSEKVKSELQHYTETNMSRG